MQISAGPIRIFFALLLVTVVQTHGELLVEIHQVGTDKYDEATDAAADILGNTFIGGFTLGNFSGDQAGEGDGFVSLLERDGSVKWTVQFGTESGDTVSGIDPDGRGNVYATGTTLGALGLGADVPFDLADTFVAKIDVSGNVLWIDQFGTDATEASWDIAVHHDGSAYSVGDFFDANDRRSAVLAKHDSEGNRLWVKRFGSPSEDRGRALDVDDEGNVYVTGYTTGLLGSQRLGGFDSFVSKFDSDGNELWTQQFGTNRDDFSFGIAVENDSVFITGGTDGNLDGQHQGSGDIFVTKLDFSGVEEWSRQFGTSANDGGTGISIDEFGNVVVAARTSGSLFGDHEGFSDVAVFQLDELGNLLASTQFGTGVNDTRGWHSSTDPLTGDILVSGSTEGSLGGQNLGSRDIFFARIHVVPEQSHCGLFAVSMILLFRRRIRG